MDARKTVLYLLLFYGSTCNRNLLAPYPHCWVYESLDYIMEFNHNILSLTDFVCNGSMVPDCHMVLCMI